MFAFWGTYIANIMFVYFSQIDSTGWEACQAPGVK